MGKNRKCAMNIVLFENFMLEGKLRFCEEFIDRFCIDLNYKFKTKINKLT